MFTSTRISTFYLSLLSDVIVKVSVIRNVYKGEKNNICSFPHSLENFSFIKNNVPLLFFLSRPTAYLYFVIK